MMPVEKFLIVTICVTSLAAASIACAWFPWWIAAPGSLGMGMVLAVAAEKLRDTRRKRDQRYRPQPQPRPTQSRFTARTYHRN